MFLSPSLTEHKEALVNEAALNRMQQRHLDNLDDADEHERTLGKDPAESHTTLSNSGKDRQTTRGEPKRERERESSASFTSPLSRHTQNCDSTDQI